jgi:hypothetical protein
VVGVVFASNSHSSPLNSTPEPIVNVKDGFLNLGCPNTPQLGDDWCATCTDILVKDQSAIESLGVPEALISTTALSPALATDDNNLENLNVTQLKTHCKVARLPTTGLKQVLLERLKTHYEDAREQVVSADGDAPQARDPNQYYDNNLLFCCVGRYAYIDASLTDVGNSLILAWLCGECIGT